MDAPGVSQCPSENEVLSLVRGTMAGPARALAHAHVDACEACQELLAALMGTASPDGETRRRPTGRRGPLAPGDEVGRYRIREELGAGAMGVVYLADDRDLDRLAAVKMMQGQAAETSERLLHEAQSLARLSHPNVIVVYEVGTVSGQVFMAMEFVDGSSLTAWLARERRPLSAIVDVFVQAGRGLAVAHAAGLVHRDFKPDNVLVGRDGRVRVVDFGLARSDAIVIVRDTPDGGPDIASSGREALRTLTRTGAFVGTPAYMAPEQFDGRAADARTDQFGFCVALFEALFERHPFDGDTLDTLMRAVKSGQVRVPRTPRVPRRIARAVLRGLSVRPEDRFPSMDALLAELAPAPRSFARAASGVAVAGAMLVAAAFVSARTTRTEAVASTPAFPHVASAAQLVVAPSASTTPPAASSAAASPSASTSASAAPRPAPRPRAAPAPPPSASVRAPAGPLMPTTP